MTHADRRISMERIYEMFLIRLLESPRAFTTGPKAGFQERYVKVICGILCTLLAVALQTPTVMLAQSVASPKFDILLKGAHVIDPKNQIDRVTDVAVANGHIASVADNI